MLVAIDGPAGAGKSTVARSLARELGFSYLDSGAMYRCVALLSLQTPAVAPAELARRAQIEFAEREGSLRVFLQERDVTASIREPEVSECASRVASDAGVREALVAKQRMLIDRGDWVAEGRDIGTVVAPEAELKVFLTASEQERARRRAGELGAAPAVVLAEQQRRDERDSTRSSSPLRPAHGAVVFDTTGMDVAQVVAEIATLAHERTAST